MTITPSEIKYRRNLRKSKLKIRTATLFLLSIVILSAVIVAAWFAGENQINAIFAQINFLQRNPPMWLEAPMVTAKYLLAPTVALLLTVLAVMKISPQPRIWSRRLVVGILLLLTGRYVLWRSLSTLNLDTPLNGAFSLGLFGLEMMVLFSATIQLFLMLNLKERRHEADRKSIAVIEGEFNPSVDVLIPTYNEPAFILRRTIVGCQALEYKNKTIYLLDDTRRPEMKALAEELGCEYISRMQNNHAKAGNINHAFTQINGELIVVFDADLFLPQTFLLVQSAFSKTSKLL